MPAAFVYDGDEVAVGGKEILSVYFNPTEESLKENVLVTNEAGKFYSTRFNVSFINKIYENGDHTICYEYDYLNRLIREDNKKLNIT